MAKLYIYYQKAMLLEFGKHLKIKINDKVYPEISANNYGEIDLPNEKYDIKMYVSGQTGNLMIVDPNYLVGFKEEKVVIDKDTYYLYKGPKLMFSKPKLMKLDINNYKNFKYFLLRKKVFLIFKKILLTMFIISVIVLSFILE